MTENKNTAENIYAKMARVKIKLLGIKKSGWYGELKFKRGYFELGDILQVLLPALKEEGLCAMTFFSADGKQARLEVVDIGNREDKIVFETPVPEYPAARMSPVQALGATQTYIRRYLLMAAFDIAETDIIDGGPQKPETRNPKPEKRPDKLYRDNTDIGISELKQEIWEIIKDFPEKKRKAYIEECKNADGARLEDILKKLEKESSRRKEFPVLEMKNGQI
jgi:hypothetical protein